MDPKECSVNCCSREGDISINFPIQENANKQNLVKSQTHELYLEKMPSISHDQKILLKQQLRKSGFEECEITPCFQSQIFSITSSSITYLTKFMKYQHLIRVYVTNLELKQISREYLSCGMHATTELFNFQGKQIVAKVTTLKQKEAIFDEVVLKEVFLLKFASALGVSADFLPLYGYDILILKGRVQFLMEKCEHRNFANENDSHNLKKKLSIMHTFQLIHGDVKNSNFGWSKSKSEFVFYDFGISQFVSEQLGHKTSTIFFGSYQFSSFEMKKIFYCETPQKVDLYYNDLCGIEKSIKLDMEASVNAKKKPHTIFSKLSSDKFSWGDIVPFFKLKFYLQKKDYQKVLEMFTHQQKMARTFKMVISKNLSQTHERIPEIQQIYDKLSKLLKTKNLESFSDQIFEEKSLDSYLYRQLLASQSQTEFYFIHVTWGNIEQIAAIEKLCELWKKDKFKIQLFKFLYMQELEPQNIGWQVSIKKSIFVNILIVNELKSRSQLDTFFAALAIFRKFFFESKNIFFLQQIQCICTILYNLEALQETHRCINEIVQENQSCQDFISEYVMYFFFKISYLFWQPQLLWQKYLIDKLLRKQSSQKGQNLSFFESLKKRKDTTGFYFKEMREKCKKEYLTRNPYYSPSPKCEKQKVLKILQYIENIKIPQNKPMVKQALQCYEPTCLQKKLTLQNLNKFRRDISNSISEQAENCCPILSQIKSLRNMNCRQKQQSFPIISFCLLSLAKFSSLTWIHAFYLYFPLFIDAIIEEKFSIQDLDTICADVLKNFGIENRALFNQIPTFIQTAIHTYFRIGAQIISSSLLYAQIEKLLKIKEIITKGILHLHSKSAEMDQYLKQFLDVAVSLLGLHKSQDEAQLVSLATPIHNKIMQDNFSQSFPSTVVLFFNLVSEKQIFGRFFFPENRRSLRDFLKKSFIEYSKNTKQSMVDQESVLVFTMRSLLKDPGSQIFFFDYMISLGSLKHKCKEDQQGTDAHIVHNFYKNIVNKNFLKERILSWSLSQMANHTYRVLICSRFLAYLKVIQQLTMKNTHRLLKMAIFGLKTVKVCPHFKAKHILTIWNLMMAILKIKKRKKKVILLREYIRIQHNNGATEYEIKSNTTYFMEVLQEIKIKRSRCPKKNEVSLMIVKKKYQKKLKRVKQN